MTATGASHADTTFECSTLPVDATTIVTSKGPYAAKRALFFLHENYGNVEGMAFKKKHRSLQQMYKRKGRFLISMLE
jgi:hypothetical protein